jgi:ABC-type transport system involved in multi-copper enzyme maturation permease subunit
MRRIRTIAAVVLLEMLRRKDIYVLLIMLGTMLLGLVSMNIFGLGSVDGFVKDAGLLATWLFGWILATNCASRQIPQEESRGTILPLLAKPVQRWQFIAGKWMGAWAAAAIAVISFYILTELILVGFGSSFNIATLLQALVLHLVAIAVIVALAVALSTRLHHDAAATITYVASAAMFLLVPRIPELANLARGWRQTAMLVLYGFLPHFELFDMRRRLIHQYGPMPWGWFAIVIIYGAVLASIMLCLAWLGFHNKHFSRGNQD